MPVDPSQIFSSAGNILLVVAGFGFVIFVHELGHFLFAKKVGAKVEIFSIGFGPKLFGVTRGGTEYRVSLIPLGGYVKITGQGAGASESQSPDDFERKPVWHRFQVLVAGVVMNFLFAFPLCMAVYLLGRTVPDCTVTDVAPGSPAFEAGLKTGDYILSAVESPGTSVDGITEEQWKSGEARNWERINQMMLLGNPAKSIFLEVKRDGRPLRLRIAPMGEMEIQQRAAAIGMQGGEFDVTVGALGKGSVNEGILAPGDIIKSVDGVPVTDPGTLNAIIFHAYRKPSGETPSADDPNSRPMEKPVRLIIERKGQPMETGATRVKGYYDPGLELCLKPVIGSVRARSAASAAGLVKGDAVVSVGFDATAPGAEESLRRAFPVERWQDIEDALGAYIVEQRPDDPRLSNIFITVQRGARNVDVEIAPEPARQLLLALAGAGRNDAASFAAEMIGIAPKPGLYVREVMQGSPLLTAEQTNPSVSPGDRIMAIDKINLADEKIVRTPQQVRTLLSVLYQVPPEGGDAAERKPPPHMLIVYQKADGQEYQRGIMNPMVSYRAWLEVETALALNQNRALIDREDLGGAVRRGLAEPFRFLSLTYESVSLLIKGRARTDQLMGPVGILQFSYKRAEEGASNFLFFLAFISINLAVLNILPIPVLDGGHVMFLLAEKLRGKPVSEKTRMRFEVVGLILIGALVLFATWNDVVGRLLGL